MRFEQLGPYRIGRKLGQGGMGAVYEGFDVEANQKAAVKVLSPALAAEEGFRVRFEAEIESLKKLRHPHIVRLYGYGEQEGTLFYAMELVEGTSLEEELRSGRRFHWREVVHIAVKLSRALKHAHDHGVIHRDLKPANLLVTEEGDVKLSDFGIARLFGNTRLTTDGGVLGTAEYMSPEQVDGRPLTDRCDQYSLGGVMYALLAGRPPFRAETLIEMLQLQRMSDPPPLQRFAPDTPTELEQIVRQLLEKDPQRRFANTMVLARSLEAMERGLSVSMSHELPPPEASDSIWPAGASINPRADTMVPDEMGEPRDADHAFDVQLTEATVAYAKKASATRTATAPEATERSFVKVGETVDRGTPWYQDALRTLASGQTLALMFGLSVFSGVVWYAIRPPSADKLYRDIEAAQATSIDEGLDEIELASTAFLERYPDDPRAADVRRLQADVAQAQPVERAYREAQRLTRLNPEAAHAELQAVIDLHGGFAKDSEFTARYVKQAERRLKQLDRQLRQAATADLALVESRLQRAAELATTDPAAARTMWQAVVELYGDKPWAAEAVQRARTALSESESPAPPQPDARSAQ